MALCIALTGGLARADESLDQLIKRADTAAERDRAALYTEIAERQLHKAEQLYGSGQTDNARAAVHDVVTYAEKAAEASDNSAGRIKHTEISLRKMAAKLRDLRRTVEFDEQKPLEEGVDRLEKLRTDLLSRMFTKGTK